MYRILEISNEMAKDRFLKYNIIWLAVGGLWPSFFKYKKALYILHLIYSFLICSYFTIFLVSEYIDLFQNLDAGLSEIVNNLTVSLLYSVTMVKILLVKYSKKINKIVQQIKITESIILEGDDEEAKTIFHKAIKLNYLLGNGIMLLVFVTVELFFVYPFIHIFSKPETSNDECVYQERPLPFKSWYPFDRYKYYHLTLACQIIAGNIGGSLTGMTDILIWGFIIYGIAQIKILHAKIANLRRDSLIYSIKHGNDVDSSVKCLLTKCIHLHQMVIKYFTDLNASVNILMLLDFFICSMQFGCIGFQMIVGGLNVTQITTMEYLFVVMLQMFIFYWCANEISLESANLSMAVWESEFYEFSANIQKTLLVVMMRSQKPLNIKLGPFYPMSNAVAITIVRSSYTYVALLRQFYN